jgi:hypothetical protein
LPVADRILGELAAPISAFWAISTWLIYSAKEGYRQGQNLELQAL